MLSCSAPREVFLACDFCGVDVKNAVKAHLERDASFTVTDFGTQPYYTAGASVARRVAAGREERAVGVLVCGTGMGVGITANKHMGVRAATCESVLVARCARAINDANVLCLGQFFTSAGKALDIVDAFMQHGFVERPRGEDGCGVSWWSDAAVATLKVNAQGLQGIERDAVKDAFAKLE